MSSYFLLLHEGVFHLSSRGGLGFAFSCQFDVNDSKDGKENYQGQAEVPNVQGFLGRNSAVECYLLLQLGLDVVENLNVVYIHIFFGSLEGLKHSLIEELAAHF